MCRRLAKSTTDARTAEVLRQMADEGKQDMRKLMAEHEAMTSGQDRPEV